MKKINLAYEEAVKNIDSKADLDKDFRAVIDKVINLAGVDIEIIGAWIWVSGNTYPIKDELKEAGFYWASKKKMWYWRREEDSCKSSRGKKSIEQIRKQYGSQKVKRIG